jgi:HEAT repeat protein
MASRTVLNVAFAVAAAGAAGVAGWYFLGQGPAGTATTGGGRIGDGDGAGHDTPADRNGGTGGAPVDDPGASKVPDPGDGEENDDDLDRTPSGEEGGPTTEEILEAAKRNSVQGWLDVERLLSVAGSADPRVTDMLLKHMSDLQFRNTAANLAKYLKDPGALAKFLELAKAEGDDNTRSAALQASANIGGPGVFEAAQDILRSARPGSILASSAAGALGTLGTVDATRVLVDMLRQAVGTPHSALYVEALGRVHGPEAIADMGRMANDDATDARLREQLLNALGRTKDPAAVPEIARAAREATTDEMRTAAYNALGMVGDPAAVSELMNVLYGEDNGKKAAAAFALQNVRNKASAPLLNDALGKPLPPEMKSYVVAALGKAGDRSSVEALGKILGSGGESDALRAAAARSMGEIGDPSAAGPLLDALEGSPSSPVRSAALRSLLSTAGAADLPRVQRLLDKATPQGTEAMLLDGLVRRLKKEKK